MRCQRQLELLSGDRGNGGCLIDWNGDMEMMFVNFYTFNSLPLEVLAIGEVYAPLHMDGLGCGLVYSVGMRINVIPKPAPFPCMGIQLRSSSIMHPYQFP